MAFRYNDEDTKRLQKAINNYNKKVNRLTKNNHPYLPEKVSMSNIKANINKDIQDQLDELEKCKTKLKNQEKEFSTD